MVKPEFDVSGYYQIKPYLNLIDWDEFTAPKNDVAVFEEVQAYHEQNNDKLIRTTDQVDKLWHTKENQFINLAKKIFTENDFSNEEYICYPTIWPLVARDPQKHRIAFPSHANESDSCSIIAHELLHELFYHHLYNTFGENIDLNSESIFDISEVLNVLILREDEWQKEFPFEVRPYTKHVKLLKQLTPIWQEKNNLDEFIKKAINVRS